MGFVYFRLLFCFEVVVLRCWFACDGWFAVLVVAVCWTCLLALRLVCDFGFVLSVDFWVWVAFSVITVVYCCGLLLWWFWVGLRNLPF